MIEITIEGPSGPELQRVTDFIRAICKKTKLPAHSISMRERTTLGQSTTLGPHQAINQYLQRQEQRLKQARDTA